MISVTAFSQNSLVSYDKTVCSWSPVKADFDKCIDSRANIKFIFSADWSTLYTVGDVNATFFLDEGSIEGNIMTFNAQLDNNEKCMIFMDSKNKLIKFLFKEQGTSVLVVYFL